MTRGFFFISTDRGVGQTLVAGALAAALTDRGLGVAVMSPVEVGCPTSDDLVPAPIATQEQLIPAAALFLQQMSGCERPLELVNPYRYGAAVPPLLAAEAASRPIDLELIVERAKRLERSADLIVIDAPGLMTPLAPGVATIDLAERLELVTVIVSAPRADAIDIVALVLEALKSRDVSVGGVVINCTTERRHPEEAAAPRLIEECTSARVLGAMPYFNESEREDRGHLARRISAHLDLDRMLEQCST